MPLATHHHWRCGVFICAHFRDKIRFWAQAISFWFMVYRRDIVGDDRAVGKKILARTID